MLEEQLFSSRWHSQINKWFLRPAGQGPSREIFSLWHLLILCFSAVLWLHPSTMKYIFGKENHLPHVVEHGSNTGWYGRVEQKFGLCAVARVLVRPYEALRHGCAIQVRAKTGHASSAACFGDPCPWQARRSPKCRGHMCRAASINLCVIHVHWQAASNEHYS
jgi:hypothetical protein